MFGWRLGPILGCWPGKCGQTCDKSYCAMYTDGCIARWAVAHFGQKLAGCPLNCIALCLLRHAALRGANEGELRGASVRSMLGVVWVDDFVFHKRVEWHEPCGGLAAGCTVCGRSLAAAQVLDEWWMGLNRQLGVSLNVEKHQRCEQTVEYAGFLFDTLRGLMLVTEDKQAVLREQAASLGRADALWAARELDSIKGRLLHYSATVRHLRVLVTELQRLMGPVPGEEEYDDIGPAPEGMVALSAELCSVLERFAPAGCPLWPPSPAPTASSAYAALLRGDAPALYCATHPRSAGPRWPGGGTCRARGGGLVAWPGSCCLSVRGPTGGTSASSRSARPLGVRSVRGFRVGGGRPGSVLRPAQRCHGGDRGVPQGQHAVATDAALRAVAADVDCLPYHVPGLVLVARWRVAGRFGPRPRCERGGGYRPGDRRRNVARGVASGRGGRMAAGHG
jgi:hypothetical protein